MIITVKVACASHVLVCKTAHIVSDTATLRSIAEQATETVDTKHELLHMEVFPSTEEKVGSAIHIAGTDLDMQLKDASDLGKHFVVRLTTLGMPAPAESAVCCCMPCFARAPNIAQI